MRNIPPNWHSCTGYSPHSVWMWKILCRILSIPRNTILALNNVMHVRANKNTNIIFISLHYIVASNMEKYIQILATWSNLYKIWGCFKRLYLQKRWNILLFCRFYNLLIFALKGRIGPQSRRDIVTCLITGSALNCYKLYASGILFLISINFNTTHMSITVKIL